jgi:translation initiation factor 4G
LTALTRPAVPGDADRVSRLIYLAGQSHLEISIYDIMFPGNLDFKLEQLSKLFATTTPSWFHYSHYLVAEVDGKTAGSLCGYNELEAGGRKVRKAFKETGWGSTKGRHMVERLQSFYRVYPSHPEDAWVIENVAVFPEFRRRGLINTLLEEILDKGRRLGYKYAELGMLIGNLPAQRAYEKAGLAIVEETTDPEFEKTFGSPGMARMVVQL